MKTFIIVGHTGRGKSQFTKDIIKKLPAKKKYIYDVNNEYGQGAALPSIEDFLEITTKEDKVKNSILVFEEATIFFSTKGRDEAMINLLVRKRHTKNLIILLFHSLADVPPYILRLIDFLVLFKTNDSETTIQRKFKDDNDILKLYSDVKNNSEYHYCKVLNLSSPS